MLNVTGIGFSVESEVTVDGNDCPVVFVSYEKIVCKIPSNVSRPINELKKMLSTKIKIEKFLNKANQNK